MKLKNLIYFNFLDYLQKEKSLKIDFQYSEKNSELFDYFKYVYTKEYVNLPVEIYNIRQNEEEIILGLIDLINDYDLLKEKSKDFILNMIKQENIENVFIFSLLVYLKLYYSHKISVESFSGKYKVNDFELNFQKIISLVLTNGEQENVYKKGNFNFDVMEKRVFSYSQLKSLNFIVSKTRLDYWINRELLENKKIGELELRPLFDLF